MNVRVLAFGSIALGACGHTPSEEPFLTPPPMIAAPAPDVVAEPDAANVAAVPAPRPAPTPPAPTPTPAAPGTANGQPEQIQASHILIMYTGSMRAPATVTRTKVEAQTLARQLLVRVRHGEDFASLARQYSDEPGAHTSGGQLPMFRHGQMVAPFEQAAFALQVGGVSEVVETPFGYHIIKRSR